MTDFRNPYQRVPFEYLVLEKNPRPRDSISETSIEDMASSILQHGIIQPLPSRIVDGIVKPFIGQRRFYGFQRALQRVAEGEQPVAGVDLSVVPVLIEDIDDRTMLERQCVENLQREDVHPRDEASGYQMMRKELGYTLAQIALKIGKRETYVSERLSLEGVPDTMWKAFDEGRLTISHLELIGSVPNPLDREEFGKLVLGGKYGDKVMSVKDAKEAKQNRFAVSLRACGFERDDATLVAIEHRDGQRLHGGACVGCEYNQGSDKAPVCVNVRCFKAKQDAVWKRVASNAEELGKRTMNKDRSSEIFANDGDCELLEASGLVDLGGKLRYQDTGHHSDDTPTWESLGLAQGSDAFAAAIVARHPRTNRVHHLLEREDAIRFAIEADPANAKLFANRPGAPKPKTEPKPEPEPEPMDEVVHQSAESDDEDHDEARTQVPSNVEPQEPVMSDTKATNLGYYVADVGAFYARAKAGIDIDELLRMTLEAACGAMTTDALHVVLAVTDLATIEESAEWSRDACIRMLCRADQDIDLMLFTTLITQLRIKGHGPITMRLQAMLNEPLPEPVEPEPSVEPEEKPLSDREKAWVLFAKGRGKGTIAKELGISENTVGNWQKRDWPSRDEVKRYEEANASGDPIEMSMEAVKAWLAANPAEE